VIQARALLLKFVAGTAALTVIAAGGPTAAADVVDLPSDWQVGEEIQLVMTRMQLQERGRLRQVFGRSRTVISLEVMDKFPAGYLMGWTIEAVELIDPPKEAALIAARVGDLVRGVRLEIETNPGGGVLSLRNLEEAQALIDAAEFNLLEELKANGLTQIQSDRIAAQLEKIFDASFVEQSFLRQPEQFMFPSGGRFAVRRPVAYDDFLANPFGGPPFPSTGTIELMGVDVGRSSALIEWRQTLNREKSRELLVDALWEFAAEFDTKREMETMLAQISVSGDATYEYDLKTGWPRSVVFVRTMTIEDVRQVDRTEIRRLEMP